MKFWEALPDAWKGLVLVVVLSWALVHAAAPFIPPTDAGFEDLRQQSEAQMNEIIPY